MFWLLSRIIVSEVCYPNRLHSDPFLDLHLHKVDVIHLKVVS